MDIVSKYMSIFLLLVHTALFAREKLVGNRSSLFYGSITENGSNLDFSKLLVIGIDPACKQYIGKVQVPTFLNTPALEEVPQPNF
jgi:hypothetical protein